MEERTFCPFVNGACKKEECAVYDKYRKACGFLLISWAIDEKD